MENWINNNHLKQENISKSKKDFLENKPFSHFSIKNFLKEEKAIELLKHLQQEKFFLKDSDLFTFLQTNDLISSKNKILGEFRGVFASEKFINYIKELTNVEISNDKLDMFASLYQDTHYLLPHDDQLDSRKIAYVLFLSNQKTNGELALYDSKEGTPIKVSKQIFPEFNKFILFKVSDKSFHEIKEVIGDTPRIAITGWFHD